MRSPPKSPDPNPIEMIWADFQNRYLTPEKCDKYVNTLKKAK